MLTSLKVAARIARNNVFPQKYGVRQKDETTTARYCYSVWLRHLVTAFNNGLDRIPGRVAEFGPGSSVGVGLCAMLSGADEYYGLDFVKYASTGRDLVIFDELVEMFLSKESIPDDTEFPKTGPKLLDYGFPARILTDNVLASSLNPERIERIRSCITTQQDCSKERIM